MELSNSPLIVRQLFDLPVGANITWEKFREGIEICRLQETPEASNAALLRYQPGASLQMHLHLGHEYILVLSGSQTDEAGKHSAGTLLIYHPGTSHSISSVDGCVVLAIRDRPVSFAIPPERVVP